MPKQKATFCELVKYLSLLVMNTSQAAKSGSRKQRIF